MDTIRFICSVLAMIFTVNAVTIQQPQVPAKSLEAGNELESWCRFTLSSTTNEIVIATWKRNINGVDEDIFVYDVVKDTATKGTLKDRPGVQVRKGANDETKKDFALVIPDMQPSDEGAYRCSVIALYNDSPATAESTEQSVTVNVKPRAPYINVKRISESEYQITCTSEDGRPAATLDFYKGQDKLDVQQKLDQTETDGKFKVVATAVIVNVTERAVYNCKASHPLGEQTSTSQWLPMDTDVTKEVPETTTSSTTPAPKDKEDPKPVTQSLPSGAVIAIVICAIILMVIVLDVYCYCAKEKGVTMLICVHACGKKPKSKEEIVKAEEGTGEEKEKLKEGDAEEDTKPTEETEKKEGDVDLEDVDLKESKQVEEEKEEPKENEAQEKADTTV